MVGVWQVYGGCSQMPILHRLHHGSEVLPGKENIITNHLLITALMKCSLKCSDNDNFT